MRAYRGIFAALVACGCAHNAPSPAATPQAPAATPQQQVTPEAPQRAEPPITRTTDGQPERFEGACPPLDEYLTRLAGPNAVDCGTVPIGEDQAPAIRCAREAHASGQALRVTFEHQGKDSKLATAWVRDAQDQLYRVSFDSDAHGGGRDRPTIIRYACDELSPGATDSSTGNAQLVFECTRWREPRTRCAPID